MIRSGLVYHVPVLFSAHWEMMYITTPDRVPHDQVFESKSARLLPPLMGPPRTCADVAGSLVSQLALDAAWARNSTIAR